MEFLTLLNIIDPTMPRETQHYKQKNVDAVVYTNKNNKTITIDEDTYTPNSVLLYHIDDTIELSIPIYNNPHAYKINDIETIVIT